VKLWFSLLAVTFPVPWGHIAAKAWGNPMGKPVLALHGKYFFMGTIELCIVF
jgi:hypothetical protein